MRVSADLRGEEIGDDEAQAAQVRVQGSGALEALKGEQTATELASRFWHAPDDSPSMEEGVARRGDGHLPAWPQPNAHTNGVVP